ncbi:4Fe-4S ferredoxin, iron-sulfur binding domain protein [Vulcanisaeta moutnovskia 768-28]|uniref:4Fe-4S ferredoxin, iron-sulfur binding domain protein n=1 Tax=Vulcanisaeta moutnovskia (strain 768-28) TaxID=985053 RepID=F0QV21_VULM7|nr:(Fe-S)-binding protein [Vulcanisaeta moutnovskia]ADY00753.1 4Fe-4S ferredoxin, iron-sulfur binding domain protein [Vulcanisaeta moutnovskia 768-28]
MMSIKEVYEEVRKCQFCGFCEFPCPTFNTLRSRAYGPRGRINLIKTLIENGFGQGKDVGLGGDVINPIMTCLHCAACDTQCPAGIRIADAIHSFKAIILETMLK